MKAKLDIVQRVIGFDSHPDSFTAALLQSPREAFIHKQLISKNMQKSL